MSLSKIVGFGVTWTAAFWLGDLKEDIEDLLRNRDEFQLLGLVQDVEDGDDLEKIIQCLKARGEFLLDFFRKHEQRKGHSDI